MTTRRDLPPGPAAPTVVQTIGWWNRPVAFLERCRARFGRRFTIRLLRTPPFVMLSDPEELREVFTAPPDVLHPGAGARILEPIVGSDSVILLDGGAHLKQRKLMLPAFHGERMAALTELVAEVTDREVARWPAREPITLHPRLQALTLEIILQAVFGLDRGARLDALRGRLTAILDFGGRPMSLLPDVQPVLQRFGPWRRFAALQQETDALLFELIEERREAGGTGDDVLAMLLEARHEDGSPMSPKELRDELMTLLVAGHETTASQLAWTFERLAREPRVLERLREEVAGDAGTMNSNGNGNGNGNGSDYLTATIQESLRRRPVLPNAAPRLVKRPVEIGGWRYPEGVCVVANAYLVHHDAAVYDDPYSFRPERFLGEAPGTYTWIPFGGGRRRCLGASFALLEMKIVLRSVLARGGLQGVDEGREPPRRRAITISPGEGARAVIGTPA